MAASTTTLNAAIQVYTLTIAYLQGAQISNDGPTTAVRAEEVSPNYFYIWQLEQNHEPRWFDTLTAACIYDKAARIWTVQLLNGEALRVQDKGNIWELAKSMAPKRKSVVHTVG